jgi:hypothetical protein
LDLNRIAEAPQRSCGAKGIAAKEHSPIEGRASVSLIIIPLLLQDRAGTESSAGSDVHHSSMRTAT